MNNTRGLQHAELEAVYAISRTVAETLNIDKALASIVQLARPVFIFDNAVLYLVNDSGALEPAFARAIGRGRSSEADSAWGEMAAKEAFQSGSNFLYQPLVDPKADRLEQRSYLALPMLLSGKCIGALVFIRFGGPPFTEEQINLAEFIAAHVTQVLEHKRLVERIGSLEAERRLAQLQSDFVANISHEIKTPLGFIKGYSTSLLRKEANWDEATQTEFLSIIDEETDHLTELVDNLLDSSRLQSGILEFNLQPIDLNGLVGENIERLRSRYNALDIRWKPPKTETMVIADAKRISQVLDNLLGNASKYAPNGPIKVSVTTAADQAEVHVKDSGPGINPEEIDHIFKRFYRSASVKDKVRGTGLGLYICKQIVDAHHGNIRVTLGAGEGAEFIVSLPKQEPAKGA